MGVTATRFSEKQLDPTKTGYEAQNLEADLRRRVVGQDEAIQQVVRVYQTYLAGMCNAGRPFANILFLGPTGSGKTRLVEALAESLLGAARSIVKIDCGEFQHSHEIAKLIGSPPGYIGHRETQPLLSQEVLDRYHTARVKLSFVLFDEIEKSSDALWNLLIGILDKATLTLGCNRRVDFSKSMIFMTSNLGAAAISAMLQPGVGFTGFQNPAKSALGRNLTEKMSRAAIEAARRKFSPEFMNRIDRAVVFQPLGPAELRDILTIELRAVQERILNANTDPFVLDVTHTAREYLLRHGTDMTYGARHLKRAIDRLLVHPLSNLISTGQICGGDVIRVDFDGIAERLSFFKDASRVPDSLTTRITRPASGWLADCLRAGLQPAPQERTNYVEVKKEPA